MRFFGYSFLDSVLLESRQALCQQSLCQLVPRTSSSHFPRTLSLTNQFGRNPGIQYQYISIVFHQLGHQHVDYTLTGKCSDRRRSDATKPSPGRFTYRARRKNRETPQKRCPSLAKEGPLLSTVDMQEPPFQDLLALWQDVLRHSLSCFHIAQLATTP